MTAEKKKTHHAARRQTCKFATLISVVVTVIAAIGLVLGFMTGKVLWGIVLLLPTVA